jgi:outer membrane murein-binding lipoprotein Lpp
MKTNEKAIAITVIAVILAVGMLTGCVDKEVQLPIDNTAFRNIAGDACDDIAYQLEAIVTAKQAGDFVTAKMGLATLDASLKRYITEFEEMEVAENTLPCKKALILSFEETQILCVYVSAYLESLTIEEYLRYGAQSKRVMDQMEIAAMLAERL